MIAFQNSATQPATMQFVVQSGGRRLRLSYQQVFAAGYKLWLARRYAGAASVFEHISGVADRGPRAHILLAHCHAMLGDFGSCSRILAQALPADTYGNAATELHNVFVMWKCAMFLDVRKGLEKIIDEHQELPTPCLILADFLSRAGNRQQPPLRLQQAITRDRPDGAVAAIARGKLSAVETAAKPAVPPRSRRNRLPNGG